MHYDTTNTGTLWLETDLKSEKSPNFTGKSEIQCPSCSHKFTKRTAGWNKTTKNGKDLISVVYNEPKEEEPKQSGSWEQQREKFAKKDEAATEVPSQEDIDREILDSIPF
jgi:hypothetical protein